MRKLAILVVALGMSVAAFAENIGIVDARRVMSEYKQMKTITSNLDKKRQTVENDLAKRQNDLQKEKLTLDNKGNKLTDAEKKAFEKKVNDYYTLVDNKQKELITEENKQIQDVQNKVNAAIKAVAGQGKYDVIYESAAVLYASDAKDITKDVITEINK